ncbi:MAG: polysaccharide export protein [Armatimonadetes bacterium]|nr:polysaccharide export protein [Armatimonadota bacterium]
MLTKLLLCGLCLFSAAWSFGQLGPDGLYRLQADDIIRLQLRDDNQVGGEIPIGPDGYFNVPFVGAVKASGKTTNELEAELVKLYREKLGYRNPRISVTIIRYRAIRATVNGFVARPGAYEMRQGDTILVLLGQSGSLLADRADARRATLRRANSRELIPIDLQALISGDTSQNYSINDGDELNVPERKRPTITVLGTVLQPGIYGFNDEMTLMDAIGEAHGEVRTRSIMSHVYVTRTLPSGQVVRYQCDLIKFGKGDYAQNITLQPGDFVYVPENKSPDLNQLSALLNTLYFFNQLGRSNLLGLKIFP